MALCMLNVTARNEMPVLLPEAHVAFRSMVGIQSYGILRQVCGDVPEPIASS